MPGIQLFLPQANLGMSPSQMCFTVVLAKIKPDEIFTIKTKESY